jgi:hypothetical protein
MELIEIVIGWVTGGGLAGFLAVATSVVGTFALIATITPTKSDDAIVAALEKVIHFLGANFGKAANKGS